jgi:hypothetical protein
MCKYLIVTPRKVDLIWIIQGPTWTLNENNVRIAHSVTHKHKLMATMLHGLQNGEMTNQVFSQTKEETHMLRSCWSHGVVYIYFGPTNNGEASTCTYDRSKAYLNGAHLFQCLAHLIGSKCVKEGTQMGACGPFESSTVHFENILCVRLVWWWILLNSLF